MLCKYETLFLVVGAFVQECTQLVGHRGARDATFVSPSSQVSFQNPFLVFTLFPQEVVLRRLRRLYAYLSILTQTAVATSVHSSGPAFNSALDCSSMTCYNTYQILVNLHNFTGHFSCDLSAVSQGSMKATRKSLLERQETKINTT